jgi:hypothetical protein
MADTLLIRVWAHLQKQITALEQDVAVIKSKVGATSLPTRWTGFHPDSNVTVGAALANTLLSSMYMGMYAQQTPGASGDTFTNGFNLKSGTYTLRVYGLQDTNCGILYLYIDNVYAGAQDWYAASAATTYRDTTVEVESDGQHSLRGLVYLKNFSSSGYAMKLSAFTFIPGVD